MVIMVIFFITQIKFRLWNALKYLIRDSDLMQIITERNDIISIEEFIRDRKGFVSKNENNDDDDDKYCDDNVQDILINCATGNNQNNVSFTTTMQQLQTAIIKKLELANIQPACIEIKYIFPPAKIISNIASNTTLSSLKLSSGNLIISILDKPPIIPETQQKQQQKQEQDIKVDNDNDNNNDNESYNGTMTVHEIASDNSCLFNAVLFVAEEGTTNKSKGMELGEIIASIVMSDPIKYNKAILGKSTNEYIEYIMDSNHWGGSIELSVLANYYEIQINAIDVIINMHRFDENNNYKQCVYIIYDGIHYDALIMKCNNKIIHKFVTTNDSVLAQALSIAAERNSQKKYTDVYNFGLLCNDCNAKLKGQNEAQKHAEITGHANCKLKILPLETLLSFSLPIGIDITLLDGHSELVNYFLM